MGITLPANGQAPLVLSQVFHLLSEIETVTWISGKVIPLCNAERNQLLTRKLVEVSLTETTGADQEWIALEKHLLYFCYRPGAVSQKEVLSTSPLFSLPCGSVTFPHWAISYFLTGSHPLVLSSLSSRELFLDKWLKTTELTASRGQKPAQ